MIYKIAVFSTILNIKSLQDFINYEIEYFIEYDKKELQKFNPDIIILNTSLFSIDYLEKISNYLNEAKKILLVEKLNPYMHLEYLDHNISSIIPFSKINEQLDTSCVKAIYELNLENSPKTIHLKDDLVYHPKTGVLNLKNSKILLTAIQKRFFNYMLLREDNTVTYDEIIHTVWNEKIVSQSTLKNMVSFFNKLYPNLIINHYGIGYNLDFKQNNKELDAKIKCLETLHNFIDTVFNFKVISKDIIQLALDEVIKIFKADRVCLCSPINLNYNYFYVEFFSFTETFDPKTKDRIKLEMTQPQKIIMKSLLSSSEPLYLDENKLMPIIMEECVFIKEGHQPAKSVLIINLKQTCGRNWAFAIHQCSFERKYSSSEVELFKKIAKKILVILEMFTAIKENEMELKNLETGIK